MSKAEFMRELERLLQNIPENERVEALNYYEEYFSDAGEENEQKVLEELESPEKVADNIKDGLRANMDYRDTTPGNGQNSAWHSGAAYQNGTSYQGSTIYQGNTFYQSPPKASAEKEEWPAWAIVLIVIACIIFSPVLLGVAGSILGALAACFFGFFGLVIGFGMLCDRSSRACVRLCGYLSSAFCGNGDDRSSVFVSCHWYALYDVYRVAFGLGTSGNLPRHFMALEKNNEMRERLI